VRAVDEYAVRPWGLYLARPTPGRAQFHYLESWLLPSIGLRATIFHFNPAMNAIRTTTSMWANTRRGRTCGVPKTITSTSWSAPARARSWPMSTSCSTPRASALVTSEVAEQRVRRAVDTNRRAGPQRL